MEPTYMEITRRSQLSGITRTMSLPVSQAQLDTWKAGALAQNVFTNLTPDEREFVMTGITAQEWEEAFGGEEDEE
jgi:hypothetical protein